MIQLDNNFPNVPAAEGGSFEMPPPGGYVFTVIDVSDKPSKTAGNDMVTLSLDIAEGDHKGAFQKFPKKFFQLVNGDHTPYFKGMLQAFKESNPPERLTGLVSQSLQFNAQKLKGLTVGGCLREAEYINRDGNKAVGVEVWYLCPVKEVPDIKTPTMKKLPSGSSQKPSTGANNPPPPEDDLPF